MASYYMLRPYASPSCQDRTCCRGLRRRRNSRHLSLLRCTRNWGLWADFSSRWGQLAASSTSCAASTSSCAASSTSSTVVVVAFDNYPGRVDTAVDVGTKVSDYDFFPDILDARYRSNGRTAPPSLPYSNSSACNGPGPSDLDFEIYASNSMEDFEPPPPPRIPFGGPFEDYYGEIVGEDYIPKQEKPTSSLLQFLDSLNAKRAEEEANAEKNPKKPLFSQSKRVPSARENEPLFPDNRPLFSQSQLVEQPATIQRIAEEEPLLPQTRLVQGAAGDTSGSSSLLPLNSNVQGTTDASRPLIPQNIPIDVIPSFPQTRLSEVNIEQSVLSSQTRSVEESKEQKTLFSSPTNTLEQTPSKSRPLFPQTRTVEDSRDPLSPTTRTIDVIRDSGMPLSPQTRMVEQPRGSSIKDSRRPFSTLTGVTEKLRDSDRPLSPQLRTPEETMDNMPLSPQLRTTEETMGNRPLSPSMRPFEETRDISRSRFAEEIKDSSRPFTLESRHEEEVRGSSLPLIPQNRPMDETMDSNGPSFSQSRPVEEIRDIRRPFEDFRESRPLISQSTPFEEIRDVRPLIPQTRHMEETTPLVPQTRSVEERRDTSQSISSQARSLEETSGVSRSVFPQTRPVETTSDDRTSFAQTRPVEETLDISRPLFSQSRPLEENRDRSRRLFPQSRPMDLNRDDIRSLYPQTRPAERTVDNKPLFSGNAETIPQKNAWTSDSSELHVDQMNGVMVAKPGSPTLTSPATVMNAPDDFADVVSQSQFYEPREGDIILGAVTFANDQELDLEIGAELPALMSLRDFQPFPQIVDNIFFKLPPTDGSSQTLEGFVAPHGRSLLVEGKAAGDGSYRDEMVDIGTIVIAEVQGRAVTDGRAVLSRRLPARRLAWHRIEQLMRFGEEIQLEIVQYNEGGLLGYLEGVRAFLPRSELLQRPESTAVLNNYVGRTLSVAVVQADKQASNIIISEVKLWMSKNLQLGTVHDVTVTRIYPYGMQVEVDNTRIRGFVHISNLSQEYVSSVTSIFSEGDKARAMLVKGRNPGQVSFSIADLERDRGLLLRDKEQVFQDAEETARRFREGLSEQERQIFGLADSETRLDFQDLGIANLNWLHLGNVINSS